MASEASIRHEVSRITGSHAVLALVPGDIVEKVKDKVGSTFISLYGVEQ